MKKLLLSAIVLVVIGGIAFYFIQPNDKPQGLVEGEWELAEKSKEDSSAKSNVPKPSSAVPRNEANKAEPVNPFLPGQKLDPASLTEEEIEELEDYFDKVEMGWANKMKELIVDELKLGDDALEDYGMLRENYEEEKMVAYQEFHEFMVQKYGENYAYNPTEEMEIFENKVQDIYLEKLRKQLGDENYSRYLEVKDAYNDQLRSEQDPKKGVVLIEI